MAEGDLNPTPRAAGKPRRLPGGPVVPWTVTPAARALARYRRWSFGGG